MRIVIDYDESQVPGSTPEGILYWLSTTLKKGFFYDDPNSGPMYDKGRIVGYFTVEP